MTSHQCIWVPHSPDSPDLAIADFCLFGRPQQPLSGRTLDSEENMLETITKILSEPPKKMK
jgi:hypothetical protein